MRLHVGTTRLRGDIRRYASRFDLLELRAELGALPRPPRLREWVSAVPDGFVFSVVLPRSFGSFSSDEDADRCLSYALRAADALQAEWLVWKTTAAVTPSTRSRRHLRTMRRRLPLDRPRLAWEPSGLWEDEEAEDQAAQLGAHLVRDLGRAEPPTSPVVYARISVLGAGGRTAPSVAERVGRLIVGRPEAFVVIEGAGAARVGRRLREEVEASADGVVP